MIDSATYQRMTPKERWRYSVALGYVPSACPGCDAANLTAFGHSPGCLIHCAWCGRFTGPAVALLLRYACVPCWIKSRINRARYWLKDVRTWSIRTFRPWTNPKCVVSGHLAGSGPVDGIMARSMAGQDFFFAICKRCKSGFAVWL